MGSNPASPTTRLPWFGADSGKGQGRSRSRPDQIRVEPAATRSSTIAHSLVDRFKHLSVLILSGSPIIGSFDFRSRVDFVRVPGVIKLRNGEYTALNLHIDIEQMLKMRASDVAMRIATEAVQLHGGYGYCKDYRVERLMRDAKITQIWEGTNQIHRQLIGRSFIRK